MLPLCELVKLSQRRAVEPRLPFRYWAPRLVARARGVGGGAGAAGVGATACCDCSFCGGGTITFCGCGAPLALLVGADHHLQTSRPADAAHPVSICYLFVKVDIPYPVLPLDECQ